MKTKIAIVLILLAGSLLTSCDQSTGTTSSPPPPPPRGPDPAAVLKQQVESERELRREAEVKAEKAETKVEEAAVGKGHWQLAALGLSVLAVIGFIGGTSIGSRGRHHATSAS